MIPNKHFNTTQRSKSFIWKCSRYLKKKMALLNSAMPYLLIQIEFWNCLSLLSDLYACTWALSQLFQNSEFTSHHSSHHDSWKLSCQSSTTLGKQSITLLPLYLEPIKVLKGTTCCSNWEFWEARAQFNSASMGSSSRRLCSPRSHCWQTTQTKTCRSHLDNLFNMTWDRKERARNKCRVVTKKQLCPCSKHTLHRTVVRIMLPQWQLCDPQRAKTYWGNYFVVLITGLGSGQVLSVFSLLHPLLFKR